MRQTAALLLALLVGGAGAQGWENLRGTGICTGLVTVRPSNAGLNADLAETLLNKSLAYRFNKDCEEEAPVLNFFTDYKRLSGGREYIYSWALVVNHGLNYQAGAQIWRTGGFGRVVEGTGQTAFSGMAAALDQNLRVAIDKFAADYATANP